MAMTSVTGEIKSSNVTARRMFKAVIEEHRATYTTIFPQMIKTIETIQGDGSGPGTIFKMCFINSVTNEEKSQEIKVEAIDPVNLYAKYTMTMEGDQVVNEVKLDEVEGGGCILKLTNHYVKKAEGIYSDPEKPLRVLKMVFEYLSANPDFCVV